MYSAQVNSTVVCGANKIEIHLLKLILRKKRKKCKKPQLKEKCCEYFVGILPFFIILHYNWNKSILLFIVNLLQKRHFECWQMFKMQVVYISKVSQRFNYRWIFLSRVFDIPTLTVLNLLRSVICMFPYR